MSGRSIVLLLGGVFIGVPLALIWLFVRGPTIDRVSVGAQPGGRAAGRVVDARGEPIGGASIEAFLARPRSGTKTVEHDLDHLPELERSSCATAVSGADGAFAIELPAGDGFYALTARTPTTVRDERWLSLLDGEKREPLTFALRSGARLTVVFVGAVDGPRGFYDLSTVIQGGLMRMKESIPSTTRGAFAGRELVIESLAVSPVRLVLDLAGGEHLERELALAFGENHLRIELGAR
ncbi:MAG: carboxypeptidase-like regulatory domain-containing protein [Planctomycetes bacterium]|nr:carboxypeptidase-like regulatory domain-containing protein [Planctomycetota bacterium]